MFPIELARFIDEQRISVWYSVPSVLTMLLQKGGLASGDLPRIRTVLFAGEVFPTKFLRALMALLPHARFCNLYGPTETNVCTWYDVPVLDVDRVEPIPIGKVIPGAEAFLMTESGSPAQPGETGFLYVAGATVMRGYWDDEERTRARLVSGPPGRDPRELVYDTGDLVREDASGDYIFVGRRDNQVKSRGYRIELGDIESTLVQHEHVVECAVLAVPDELITNRLTAVVVTDEEVKASVLSRFCAERLPSYMIPESFTLVGELPKTSTGKTDRRRLAEAAGVGA
jgi:acyl-coenzyme A synthetase/AMP-(fatty) acid ligase